MADNGSAGNLFNDRRGMNPFQPVAPAPVRFNAQPSTPSVNTYGGDSYLGHGMRLPNGALPRVQINGKVFTRANPDQPGLRQRQVEIGERGD